MERQKPLISIMIPNYNHGRFLDECVQSALDQTYQNKEIIVLDNQSQDNSLEVLAKYQKDGVRVCRNSMNILNLNYSMLSQRLASGEFFVLLGADDALKPTFVEKAVDIMTRYPSVGYVHGERDFMREDSSTIELDPFFNCSFVAPGRSVMPIYMVTTIAHPAQGVIRRSVFERIGGYSMEIDHMNADKSMWFYLSAISDYGYIREKMCRIRVSSNSQTALAQQNFQHPVLCHLIINDFTRYAEQFGYSEVVERKGEALRRLAKDFLIYAGGMLAHENYEGASSYLTYAKILDRDVTQDETWQKLNIMQIHKKVDHSFITSQNTMYEARKRNYAPPVGFMPIDEGGVK